MDTILILCAFVVFGLAACVGRVRRTDSQGTALKTPGHVVGVQGASLPRHPGLHRDRGQGIPRANQGPDGAQP